MTISRSSRQSVIADLPWLFKLKELTVAIAQSYDLDPCVVFGILSRESGGGRLLGKWGNPKDTGDRGHGRGVMQMDDRTWKGALDLNRDGVEDSAWRAPAFSIAFGCWLLSENLAMFDGRLDAGLAAYNCGPGRVKQALKAGKSVDAYTAGRNYSADVIARAAYIAQLGL